MSNFNEIRYGAVIEILMLENVQPQVLHNWMTVVCGEDVLLYAMVKWWTAEFCGGRTRLEVEPPSGHPSLAVHEENCHAVENSVLQNCRVNMQQIADTVGISTSSVNMIFTKYLQMTKVCVLWVPQMFDQKRRFVDEKHQMKIWNSYSETGIFLFGT